jgi:hypothetical protein
MNKLIHTLTLAVVVATVGCTAQNFCAKRQECNDKLEDDSYNVCVEEVSASYNALRANEEDDCQKLADAQLALLACEASLDCDDFEESDLGGKCDDELDDVRDAQDDAGGACSSLD